MVEFNPKNADILRKIFGKSANIYKTNYLQFFEKDGSNSNSVFDIIIGNPPYNVTKKVSAYAGAQNTALWPRFVEISIAHLAPGGHLGFITPANWRKPEHPLYDLMVRENRLTFLHIYGKDRGLHIFGAQTRFDVYIVEKTAHTANSENHLSKSLTKSFVNMIDEKGKEYRNINISGWPFIPNYMFNAIQRLIANPGEKSNN